MNPKPVRESHAVISEVMTPRDANLHGNVFGGAIMAMADRVAFVAAARHAGPPCVTVAVDSLSFLAPIHLGELVTMYASVNHVGRTSMEIGVKVVAENLETREVRHTNSCYFVYVAIDKDGHPREAPPLIPETDEEKRRYHQAELRRELRKRFRAEAEKVESL